MPGEWSPVEASWNLGRLRPVGRSKLRCRDVCKRNALAIALPCCLLTLGNLFLQIEEMEKYAKNDSHCKGNKTES